ncbi:MAG: hypothetical protein NTY06_01310 [Candidatus Gottesmanbacteria bacterium]|nr:hypothetical protein [Candidatus Gottesmanbacteria bacterium]
MNNNDLGISYSLRKSLQDKDIQSVISDLYENRAKKDAVSIYLPFANKRYDEICDDPYHEGSDKANDLYFALDDTKLLKLLERTKILKIKELSDDDDGEGGGMGLVAMVTIIKPEYIEHLYEWIKDDSFILNYGIFSLHTFTGEAYCRDNQYIFHTNKGLFRVFQAFLTEPTHILPYQKIYNYFQGGEKPKCGAEKVHQIIGEVKEKLRMTGKLSKLFIPSEDKYFLNYY